MQFTLKRVNPSLSSQSRMILRRNYYPLSISSDQENMKYPGSRKHEQGILRKERTRIKTLRNKQMESFFFLDGKMELDKRGTCLKNMLSTSKKSTRKQTNKTSVTTITTHNKQEQQLQQLRKKRNNENKNKKNRRRKRKKWKGEE